VYSIQNITIKGGIYEAVNMLYSVIKTAGKEMEVKVTMFKEWDHWFDKQCKEKKREVKRPLKEYKKRNDEQSMGRYCSCKKE
jgi:hypothetical protein